jgi:hypothetical protein
MYQRRIDLYDERQMAIEALEAWLTKKRRRGYRLSA